MEPVPQPLRIARETDVTQGITPLAVIGRGSYLVTMRYGIWRPKRVGTAPLPTRPSRVRRTQRPRA